MMMGREVLPVVVDPGMGGGLKKKGTGSRSWLLVDATGLETVLDVDKYAIMHRVQIHARDLRILDPLLSYPSTILGRERAIVLNLEHIKAIITAEEVKLGIGPSTTRGQRLNTEICVPSLICPDSRGHFISMKSSQDATFSS